MSENMIIRAQVTVMRETTRTEGAKREGRRTRRSIKERRNGKTERETMAAAAVMTREFVGVLSQAGKFGCISSKLRTM